MFDISWPWIFTLLPLPWLAARYLPCATRSAPLKLPAGVFLPGISSPTEKQSARPQRFALLLWLLLLCALAGPRWLGDPQPLPQQGRDLMLAVDLSGSMAQRDLSGRRGPNRLEVVKGVMEPFIERRNGDRLGLIVFGSKAYLQAPLSYDRHSIAQFLNETMINLAGKKTAIGDAIGLAIKQLRNRPGESRVLLLITDGQNTAGSVAPLQAAQLALKSDVKIYTIGVGGRSRRQTDLDEKSLQQIAQLTGGLYFRAHSNSELEAIYEILDELEPSSEQGAFYRPELSLYHWPLGLALLISFLLALQPLLMQARSHLTQRRADD